MVMPFFFFFKCTGIEREHRGVKSFVLPIHNVFIHALEFAVTNYVFKKKSLHEKVLNM